MENLLLIAFPPSIRGLPPPIVLCGLTCGQAIFIEVDMPTRTDAAIVARARPGRRFAIVYWNEINKCPLAIPEFPPFSSNTRCQASGRSYT